MWTYNYNNELYHYGILGMKWGVRRFQNEDSSLTAAGKKRYGDKSPYEVKTADGDTFRIMGKTNPNLYRNSKKAKVTKTWGEHYKEIDDKKIEAAGRKKISKKYKKLSIKGDKDLRKNYNSMYVKAYNKTADEMNNGEIDRFNNEQRKKYGKDFAKRYGYSEDYNKLFNDKLQKNLNKSINDFVLSNTNYQEADALVKKYNMTEWDDLAKYNQEGIDYIRSIIEK